MEQAIRVRFSVSHEHDMVRDIQRTLENFAGKGVLQKMS